ncbi:unnamed protein product [Staurois parvus]|uniref:Uncharacterized protein n=1 Tax=Staurois parvus TaxID=386267 RepID=A0ABN9CUB5_9NEOB|nr:unnamed protein product [Staurois parvus]
MTFLISLIMKTQKMRIFHLYPLHTLLGAEKREDAGDMENGDDWTRNMGETQPEEEPKPARRAVKRPQPKLDANRLTSQRGLPALRNDICSMIQSSRQRA